MNLEEFRASVERDAVVLKEVHKRRGALGKIINAERFRNKFLTDMFKAGAMVGGVCFLIGLLFVHDARASFPKVAVGALVAFIATAFYYAGATTAFESTLESEIKRRMKEYGSLN